MYNGKKSGYVSLFYCVRATLFVYRQHFLCAGNTFCTWGTYTYITQAHKIMDGETGPTSSDVHTYLCVTCNKTVSWKTVHQHAFIYNHETRILPSGSGSASGMWQPYKEYARAARSCVHSHLQPQFASTRASAQFKSVFINYFGLLCKMDKFTHILVMVNHFSRYLFWCQ